MKKLIKYFDKLEDRIRARLSRRPILYAFIAGIGMVLFWRAAWNVADLVYQGVTISDMYHTAVMLLKLKGWMVFLFYEPVSLIWVILILLVTGLFVSFFIGDRIIISGIKREKKVEEKTEEELLIEEGEIKSIKWKINQLAKDVEEIKNAVIKKQ